MYGYFRPTKTGPPKQPKRSDRVVPVRDLLIINCTLINSNAIDDDMISATRHTTGNSKHTVKGYSFPPPPENW